MSSHAAGARLLRAPGPLGELSKVRELVERERCNGHAFEGWRAKRSRRSGITDLVCPMTKYG